MAYGVKGHRTVTIHQDKVHINQYKTRYNQTCSSGSPIATESLPTSCFPFQNWHSSMQCSQRATGTAGLTLGIGLICFQDGTICVCCNCLLHPFDVEVTVSLTTLSLRGCSIPVRYCDPVEIQTSFLSLGVDLSPKLMTVTPEHSMTKNLRHWNSSMPV